MESNVPRWAMNAVNCNMLRYIGASWGASWSILGHLGASWGASWGILGHLGGILGVSWGILGRLGASLASKIDQKSIQNRSKIDKNSIRKPLGTILGRKENTKLVWFNANVPISSKNVANMPQLGTPNRPKIVQKTQYFSFDLFTPCFYIDFCTMLAPFWLHFSYIFGGFSVSWASLLQDR